MEISEEVLQINQSFTCLDWLIADIILEDGGAKAEFLDNSRRL